LLYVGLWGCCWEAGGIEVAGEEEEQRVDDERADIFPEEDGAIANLRAQVFEDQY